MWWRRNTGSMSWRTWVVAGLACPVLTLLALCIYIASVPPPPLWDGISFSPLVVDRKGELMRMGLSRDDKYRVHMPLTHIPEHVRKAVLLYEDKYFYQHMGVNPFSLMRAVKSLLLDTRPVGASTIAMQVARMRYGLVSSSFVGKGQQMLLAMQLIWHYGHHDVLEAYFSLAPYGANIEGIEAAARVYFHQSAQTLTPSQALALCLIPQNPRVRAFKGSAKGHLLLNEDLEEARLALHKNWNATYPEQKVSEKAPPLRVYGLKDLPFVAPHISMELLQAKAEETSKEKVEAGHKASKDKSVKMSTSESRGDFYEGTYGDLRGTLVRSTIDSAQQNLLENHVQQLVAQGALYGLSNATAMLVHWPSMEVRASVGSADFFNVPIDGQVDGTKAKRSPGSTLKPFIYALALEQGLIHPQSMLMDGPKSFAEYNPENFDRQFQGPLPAHEALRLSRNVPAIDLASRIDPNLHTFLQRAQVGLAHDAGYYGLSLVLGGAELRMRDLVALYAMLANGGMWQPLQFVQDEKKEPQVIPVLSPEASLATLYMLEEPSLPVQGFGGQSVKMPWRYKTGTSNGFRDAWTVGVIGPYVLAVWVGNFDNTSNRMLVGSSVAVPLYKNIAKTLIWEEQLQDILAQKHKETQLVQLPTCRDTGDVQTQLCSDTVPTWFIPGRSPVTNSQVYRKIWVDTESGLRLCGPGEKAQEVVWEFWPSELYELFAQAGVHKPLPPAYAKPCSSGEITGAAGARGAMHGISIKSPRQGIVYHMNAAAETTLAFSGVSSAEAKTLFWFVNQEYVGSSTPQTPFFWQMRIGKHRVRVLDDLGHSHVVTLLVQP